MKSNFIWVLLGNNLTGMQHGSKKERKMAWNPFVCSSPRGGLGSKPGAAEAEKAHEGHQPPQFAQDEGFPGCGTFSAKTGLVPGKWDGWVPSSPFQDSVAASGKRLWSQQSCSRTPRPCFAAGQTIQRV